MAVTTLSVQPGEYFGRLTVVEETRLPLTDKDRREGRAQGTRAAYCVCNCGRDLVVAIYKLFSRNTVSCGCAKRDNCRARNHVHGFAHHPLYHTWLAMNYRCTSPNSPSYRYYGARGVRVHEPWRDCIDFIEDIDRLLGPRPEGHTLDRIDPDGNYEPGNLRWADAATQVANRRKPC